MSAELLDLKDNDGTRFETTNNSGVDPDDGEITLVPELVIMADPLRKQLTQIENGIRGLGYEPDPNARVKNDFLTEVDSWKKSLLDLLSRQITAGMSLDDPEIKALGAKILLIEKYIEDYRSVLKLLAKTISVHGERSVTGPLA